jgi:hypothetical protein
MRYYTIFKKLTAPDLCTKPYTNAVDRQQNLGSVASAANPE